MQPRTFFTCLAITRPDSISLRLYSTCTPAMEKVANRQGWERALNDGQIPNVRGVRLHASTGYNRVEGNRRASRPSPTRNPLSSDS
jgi:hypothetical protein